MTLRNIACVPLNDLFRDFERDGLSMSWVYGNIGQIMRDSEILIYGACRELHEIVDIHRLKDALENDGDISIDHLVGLLGSSLIENGIEDATKICGYLRGRLDSYDNLDHFQVIYNFKELTIDAQLPYKIPVPATNDVKPHEWKSCSLLREFIGLEAMVFARENRLHRLHDSTVLHVNLAEFQIEVSRIPDLLSLVRSKHGSEIESRLAKDDSKLTVSDPEPAEVSIRKVPKNISSVGVKHDWVGFICYFLALERHQILHMNKKSLIKHPFSSGNQTAIIAIMDKWFFEHGSIPAKNQKQQYANEILSAIKKYGVQPK